MTSDINKKK